MIFIYFTRETLALIEAILPHIDLLYWLISFMYFSTFYNHIWRFSQNLIKKSVCVKLSFIWRALLLKILMSRKDLKKEILEKTHVYVWYSLFKYTLNTNYGLAVFMQFEMTNNFNKFVMKSLNIVVGCDNMKWVFVLFSWTSCRRMLTGDL